MRTRNCNSSLRSAKVKLNARDVGFKTIQNLNSEFNVRIRFRVRTRVRFTIANSTRLLWIFILIKDLEV
jgi:hypothetical protein